MKKNNQYWTIWDNRFLFYSLLILGATSCKTSYNPTFPFDPNTNPVAPNYANADSWAAHPEKKDLADRVPKALQGQTNVVSTEVDVFYIHPTTLTEARKEWKVWNANTADDRLNKKTDDSAMQFQASAFNAAGRVFAPRYRQAHYFSFLTEDKVSAEKALNLAYEDVKTAFIYYLDHYNDNRPFIVAAHSQGAKHAARLIKELVDTTELRQQLVVAYLAGWPVPYHTFQNIPPSNDPEQTGCFCSWRTFERKYGKKHARQPEIACTNPISWKTSTSSAYVPKTAHKGAVLYRFDQVYPGICDAETYQGVLLCSKPKFRGSILLRTKNYHIGDINLFYLDIRENALLRSQAYFKQEGTH